MPREYFTAKAERWEREGAGEQIHREKSKRYKIAGDNWAKAGRPKDAIRAYRLAIKNAYNKGYKRIIEDKIQEVSLSRGRKRKGILEKRLSFATVAIISFVVALFFISFNLTGYAIGGLTQESSRWISTSLFILGLIFAFFYFKNKK